MTVGRFLWSMWRSLLTIGLVLRSGHGWFAIGLGIGLFAVSVPGFMFFPMMLALLISAPLALVWVVWAFIHLAHARWTRWLLVGPAMLTMTIAVGFIEVPLKLRFAASKGAFETALREANESADPSFQERRIGLYKITYVQSLSGGGTAFFESNGSLFDDAGFAYLPVPPPPHYDGGLKAGRFRHLSGNWYSFESSW